MMLRTLGRRRRRASLRSALAIKAEQAGHDGMACNIQGLLAWKGRFYDLVCRRLKVAVWDRTRVRPWSQSMCLDGLLMFLDLPCSTT